MVRAGKLIDIAFESALNADIDSRFPLPSTLRNPGDLESRMSRTVAKNAQKEAKSLNL